MEQTASENIDLIVLFLLREDIIFSKQLKKFIPVLEKDIDLLIHDQRSSSSKDALLSYIKINHEAVVNFVEYFLKENPQVKIDIPQIIQLNKAKDIRGKIFKINKSEEAYQNLFKYLDQNNAIYRQFSVASEEDNWVIFFL